MIEHAEYPVTVRWTEEKRGVATSADGLPAVEVASPPEFGGHENVWSPEHLYVASVASCYMITLLAIAGVSRVEVRALEIPALGELERGEDRLYSIPRMVLRPQITLAREEDRERMLRLVDKAEKVCLVSRSMTTEIRVEPVIVAEPVAAREEVALDVQR